MTYISKGQAPGTWRNAIKVNCLQQNQLLISVHLKVIREFKTTYLSHHIAMNMDPIDPTNLYLQSSISQPHPYHHQTQLYTKTSQHRNNRRADVRTAIG